MREKKIMKLKTATILFALCISTNLFAQNENVESNSFVEFIPAKIVNDSSGTKTDDASGHVGDTIRIKTFHSFSVSNDSNQTKNYTVAETCKVDGKDYKKGWGFSLPPHGKKNFSEYAFLDYQANRTGSWTIDSMTCVANSGACSSSRANLRVD